MKFWFDFAKVIYGEKAKYCYMDTEKLILYIKTNDITKDVA